MKWYQAVGRVAKAYAFIANTDLLDIGTATDYLSSRIDEKRRFYGSRIQKYIQHMATRISREIIDTEDETDLLIRYIEETDGVRLWKELAG